MKNKCYHIILLSLLIRLSVCAQSLSVEKFSLLENDLTANTRGTMKYDQNGNVAALIKIVTTETDFNFDVGSMGVVATSQQKGEIWVYVPGGVQRITISHTKLGVLRDYYFPISIEKGRTYELKLLSGTVQTIVEPTSISQFVIFKVTPQNAIVFIDDDDTPHNLNAEGMLSLRLNKGHHTYKVTAASYISESGVIELQSEKVNKQISLQSAKATLTVNTGDDSEIWIDDNKMGVGKWTGQLDAGIHLVETKKTSHRTVKQEVTLNQQEVKNITVAVPMPIYGSLEIESEPLEADVYLDGNKIGETPLIIDKVLIGNHTLVLEKFKYGRINAEVNINEAEATQLYYQLKFEAMSEDIAEWVNEQVSLIGEDEVVEDIMIPYDEYEDNDEWVDIDSYDFYDLEPEPEEEEVFMVVEDQPEFPGGTSALLEYLRKNIKYPAICRENNIQGRVVVSFVVNKDGGIIEPEIIKGVNPSLDKEALRVVAGMPKWKPGSQRGKPVRVKYTVPVNFRLDAGYSYVDLGLSVKWATYNVGANKPEDYGDYYAWGELETKTIYDWDSYKLCYNSQKSLTKYSNKSNYGNGAFTDNKIVLDLEDDVAHVKWGGNWRMPTQSEMKELLNKCTWTWTTLNGVKGYKVTSKVKGYTDKSIFLPAAGYCNGAKLIGDGSLHYYWTSSLDKSRPDRAVFLRPGNTLTGFYRRFGLTVRPVCP